MQQFRVVWEIDVEAETPEDAARDAFGHMRRSDTTATVFNVYDHRNINTVVDLTEIDHAENDHGAHGAAVRPHGSVR